MRKSLPFLVAVVATAVMTGCTGPEHKLARGFSNTFEVVRWGDMRHSVEEGAVFSSPDVNYSYGVIHGFDKSISRIGVGIYEIVTFPIPNPPHGEYRDWNYKPVATKQVSVNPQYPESYRPGIIAGSTFDTDTYTGFSGGDVAPFVPGSKFKIFDN